MPDEPRQIVAVVDDDEAVRESLRFLLETAGFIVATFGSADAFLTTKALNNVACVLLDQHMPNVTGLEALRRLRARLPEIPVALMTGSPTPETTRRALELGATEVLEKPLAEHALLRFVEHAIRSA